MLSMDGAIMPPALKKPADSEGSNADPGAEFDAKSYLERTLPREPGDLLKVCPMHQRQSFRVNWYASQAAEGATIPGLSFRSIRESKFLFCRLNAEGKPEITYPARQ
jgi:hypothetical protein